MKLKVLLVVLAAAMIPVGVVGYWLQHQTQQQARAENAARLDASTEAAARRVSERRERERRAVARLCDGDILVDRLLLDLETGRFGSYENDELVERLPHVMRAMGLATLMLIDARPGPRYGHVFAAGHFAGRAGAREAELARAVERAGERWFVRETAVWQDGMARDVQALLTGCALERGEWRVIAVGGQVLDDAFVDSLAADIPPVELFLAGAGWAPPSDAAAEERRVHVFASLDGRPAAHLVARIDDGPLQARMRDFDHTLRVALAGSFVLALLLGLALALGMTRPLAELESAADRVGQGDMSTMISVHSGGEVGKALGAFNHMVKNLHDAQRRLIRAERIAAWRDIARRIAHEIKNPLTPIKMSIETMRKTHARQHPDFDEIFEESTLTILEEVDRLQRIVTEFSRFARMPRPQPVELSVEDVVRHVVGLHAGGDVEVRARVEGAPPRVRADREQLTQVLVNLVQNGCDAASARHGTRGAKVEVVVAPDDDDGRVDGVRVEVIDNGPGIPHDEKGRVFEPYYTTKSGGTGLGLAIVHRIVSDHGGALEVDDAEGGGAVFEIRLTLRGPPVEASTTATDATVMPLVTRREE